MSETETRRTGLLREAESLVNGDRNASYGEPHQDFQRTADMASALGFRFEDGHGNTRGLKAHDVALFASCLKLSRLAWSPQKRDSWVDLAGYAACGFDAYELTGVRYFRLNGDTYYRLAAGVFTFVSDTDRERLKSGGQYRAAWDQYEVPVADVPDWAR